jgi:hypothetical protein
MAAKTEAERLRIQFEHEDKLRARRGESTSPEEHQQRQAQIEMATERERFERIRGYSDEMRGNIADSLRTGFDEGLAAGARSFIKRMRDMILEAQLNKMAGQITGQIFGEQYQQVLRGPVDLRDAMRGRVPTTGGIAGPVGAMAGQFAGNMFMPPAIQPQRGGGGDVGALGLGKGGNMTLSPQNVTIQSHTATVNSMLSTSSGAAVSGAGSSPSQEQMAFQLFRFLS